MISTSGEVCNSAMVTQGSTLKMPLFSRSKPSTCKGRSP